MYRTAVFVVFLCVSAACLLGLDVPFATKAKEVILYDMSSEMVLFEKNADVKMVPSSMTKALLIYIIFERLKSGELLTTQTFEVSQRARLMEGSRMFLEKGSQVSVENLIRGIIVTSGNDACITLEEALFPTSEIAAHFMNHTAQKLGLHHSCFMNTTGWPDENHYSSARDILKIGVRTLQDFPTYYKRYYSQQKLTHNKITQYNRNPLVHQGRGDGLKTGRTDKGGYGLLGSAMRDGRRLVFVVNGLRSESERAQTCFSMLDWGFKHVINFTLFSPNTAIGQIDIENGSPQKVAVTAGKAVVVSCLKNHQKQVTFKIEPLNVKAPLKKGAHVANVIIKSPGLPNVTKPLFLMQDVNTLSLFQRLYLKSKAFLLSFFEV